MDYSTTVPVSLRSGLDVEFSSKNAIHAAGQQLPESSAESCKLARAAQALAWHGDIRHGGGVVERQKGGGQVDPRLRPHRFDRSGFIPAAPCFSPAGSCRSSRFVQRFAAGGG